MEMLWPWGEWGRVGRGGPCQHVETDKPGGLVNALLDQRHRCLKSTTPQRQARTGFYTQVLGFYSLLCTSLLPFAPFCHLPNGDCPLLKALNKCACIT